MSDKKLVRQKKEKKLRETHRLPLEIPIPLWNRMVMEIPLEWGKATPWILEAIKEKMDRGAIHTAKPGKDL